MSAIVRLIPSRIGLGLALSLVLPVGSVPEPGRSALTGPFLTLAQSVAVLALEAQAPTAALTGQVRDSASSVPLADVEVRATDRATGYVYRGSSSATGRYWLRGLPPGTYDLTAEGFGVRAATVRQIELPVGRTVAVPLTLRRTAVELAPIVVEVDGVRVETTRSEVSFRVDQERIAALPEESRQFIDLAQLLPGATRGTTVIAGPSQFGTSGSSVGALSRQSLGVLVDGGDFTEGLFGALGGSVPLLAIREFEVVQSRYAADVGRAASGLINIVTRRGGNEVSADGFALYRHRTLNARGAFEARKPDFDRWHWGGAVGGPLVADRSHIFVAVERREQNDYATVETGGAFPEYEGTYRTPFVDNLIFGRLDHRVSEDHQLTLRYSGEVGEKLVGVGGIRSLQYGQNDAVDVHSGLVTHRWSAGGAWLNEARLHVLTQRREQLRNVADGPTLAYPSLIVGPHQAEERTRSLRVELKEEFSTIASAFGGSHRLRFGTQLSWLHSEAWSYFFENGFFQFARDTDPLPVFGQVSFREPAVRLDASNLQIGLYIQDDWTVRPGLTLELGLRYDVETNGSNQDFVSPYAGRLPFVPTTPRPADGDNLAPRIGIAWDPGRDGRTVVRGGFGIFYDALIAGPLLALERSSGVPLAQIRNPGTTDVEALTIDPQTVPPVVWTAGEIETPMTRQLSLGVEHAFASDLVVRVDGLFIQGRNLLLQRNLNPFEAEGLRYPDFSRVTQFLSEGRAEAKMVLVGLRKSFTGGWIDLGYTLADRKNTNDTWGQPLVPQTALGGLDLEREWGPAAWDERHRLVATGRIVFPGGVGVVAKTIYASARPFTAVTGTDDNGDSDSLNDRPPGEGRNARRGPDFFRTDLGITWSLPGWGPTRTTLVVDVYNLFNRVNPVPESVQDNLMSQLFGEPTAAFPPRQVEVGIRMSGG